MTIPSGLRGLRALEAKIRGLPNQDTLQRRRQIVRSTQDQVRGLQSELILNLQRVNALRIAQDNSDLLESNVKRALASASAKTMELLALLRKDDFDGRKISEKFDAIKRATKSLADDTGTGWADICNEYTDQANAIRPIAERLSPRLLARIQELDGLLAGKRNTPPNSVTFARSVVDAWRAITIEIESLAIKPAVKQFLNDAKNGTGDPKSIIDPEIRTFLDTYPLLWKSLYVVFR